MGIGERYGDQNVNIAEDRLGILHVIFYELFLQKNNFKNGSLIKKT